MTEPPSGHNNDNLPPSAEGGRPDPDFMRRANLRFMLNEMQVWRTMNRIPGPSLNPLIREYEARFSALTPPANAPEASPEGRERPAPAAPSRTDWAAELDIPGLTPAPSPNFVPSSRTPLPPPAPTRSAWSAVTEFLEERNIAALHIVGSLLLLTGILVMIRWQWEGWGRGLLLIFLSALSGGLLYFGRRITEKDRMSGLVLSALGALILPLDLVAFRLFGFLGGNSLDVPATGLLISGICGGVYAVMTRRTRHPLFGGMAALAFSCAAVFLPRAFLSPDNRLLPLAHALTLLPLSYAFFQLSSRLRRENDAVLAQPFALAGHGLIIAAFALSLLGGFAENRLLIQALVALVTSVIYADMAVRLRIPRLIYLAAFCVVLSSQLAFGGKLWWAERGCAAALAALILQVLSVWYARQAVREEVKTTDAEERRGVLAQGARAYRESALAVSALVLPPFFVAVCAGLFTFSLTTSVLRLMQGLAAALMLGVVLFWNGLRETSGLRRVLLSAALAAVFAALTSGIGLIGCLMPPLAAWIVPALCGLAFAALCLGLTVWAARRAGDELAGILDGAATLAVVLSVLSAWLYLPGLSLAPIPSGGARWAHLAVALPGLALLCGVTALRSEDFRRDRDIHLTTLTLGSLSLYFGASDGSLTADWRMVWAASGGAVMALIFALAAAFFASLRRIVSRDAGILAATTLLPLALANFLPSLALAESSLLLAQAGIAALLAAVWAVIAGTRREAFFLYGAGLMTLLTLWWAACPLEIWLDDWLHATSNPGRWFLYAAPLIALVGLALRRRQSAAPPGSDHDYAGPIFHTAIAAAALGALAQTALIWTPWLRRYAETGIAHLWLLAAGLAICAVWRRRLSFVYAAAGSGLMGYASYALFDLKGIGWSFSPWWVVLTMAIVGGCSLYTAQIVRGGTTLPAAQIGAVALLIANGHALSQLLPASLHYAWALLLLPLLGLLTWWNSGQLKETVCGLALAILGVFAFDLARWRDYDSPLFAARIALIATGGVYAALLFAVAWRDYRRDWFRAAVAVASVGILGARSGYPDVSLSIAQFGLTLAIIGGVWYGASRLLRQRPDFGRILEDAALLLTTAGSAVGLVGGIANRDSETSALLTLLVSGGVKAALAFERPKSQLRHMAFASFFAATCLFLNNHLGLSVETIDLFLLPLGLYLLAIGAFDLYCALKAGDAAGTAAERSAKNACILGLCFLLGPSLLAVYLGGAAWWHPFLLVTECLASVAVGIAYRQKLFLGFGLGFLVALLALKAYQAIQTPGQQILFAVYLLLLGAVVLAMGFFFDRRRVRS